MPYRASELRVVNLLGHNADIVAAFEQVVDDLVVKRKAIVDGQVGVHLLLTENIRVKHQPYAAWGCNPAFAAIQRVIIQAMPELLMFGKQLKCVIIGTAARFGQGKTSATAL